MNIKTLIIAIISTGLITACGGGGGSSGGGGGDKPGPSATLVPLNITLHDLNDNTISFIDISKVGSHTEYKLTFTNINKVSVTPPQSVEVDGNWFGYQMTLAKESGDEYIYKHNPGVRLTTRYFKKTNNNDDCFNKTSIAPNSSCSFYLLAFNKDTNNTDKDTFNYPMSYSFSQYGKITNKLKVEQCTYDSSRTPEYNCSNMKEPGYQNQFITYKMLPINGKAPKIISEIQNTGYDVNGEYLYKCGGGITGFDCGKYPLIYDETNNILSLSDTPTSTFTITGSGISYKELDGVFVTPDSNSAWYVFYNMHIGYRLVNSNQPNLVWEGGVGAGRVPNMEYSTFNGAIMGLDGTFWFNPSNTEEAFNADIYDANTNSFKETNIPVVLATTTDGTVLGAEKGTFGCWKKVGSDFKSYSKTLVANYIKPYDGIETMQSSNYQYVQMDIPNIVDNSGNQFSSSETPKGYYKVHTENNKCEVQLDDFVVDRAQTTKYTYGGNLYTGDIVVAPISSVYIGK